MSNEETEYMKLGWMNNVRNCNIDLERSVMINEYMHLNGNDLYRAGVIIGQLNLLDDEHRMCACGKWHWIEFNDSETAMAFKLRWT